METGQECSFPTSSHPYNNNDGRTLLDLLKGWKWGRWLLLKCRHDGKEGEVGEVVQDHQQNSAFICNQTKE
jgi:hypothetical protein